MGPTGLSTRTFFVIYMNGLHHQVLPDLLIFADIGKLRKEICEDNKLGLQEYQVKLQSCAHNKGLTFSTSNCKIIHLKHVSDHAYNLGNSSLEVCQFEKIDEC